MLTTLDATLYAAKRDLKISSLQRCGLILCAKAWGFDVMAKVWIPSSAWKKKGSGFPKNVAQKIAARKQQKFVSPKKAKGAVKS